MAGDIATRGDAATDADAPTRPDAAGAAKASGRDASPTVAASASASAHPASSGADDAPGSARRRAVFHALLVESVRPLTADAIEVAFAVPPELADAFDYRPGQHIALRMTLDGVEMRRSYSLCRAPSRLASPDPAIGGGIPAGPASTTLSVAIKRERGGAFSSWALEHLAAGDVLEVMSPDGHFTPHGQYDRPARFAAIAAGSGITPMMALIEHHLGERPDDAFDLVYSNRTAVDAMFLDELADLKDRFPARLALHHVLTRERRPADLFSGRLDEARLETLLTRVIHTESIDEWFLCGPFELVERARAVLLRLGVPVAAIRVELFSTGQPDEHAGPKPPPGEAAPGEPVRTISFRLDGTSGTVTTPVSAGETILAAALRTRGDVPFACAGGVCGTCRAVLREGTVEMAQNHALEPEELARGLILTCQSVPTSDAVSVDWDA
ncbi:2Fe-2S iron-sulfur cluster-binding protein [Microbacterium allomyrinae]|jgi:ring-1,2-phenylacetyl-CoA epoxidase subunit PaaE|uniref:2Fe-2S iron-sulfur cluster binding domain-containing protein n=1 Tax=Microbacterium allomyrinae TaxID=2830666 RepID=A0A9X1S3L7_9MICO|nr:2Fe-2S iron-sulfur cluster-binding protein [Microbacterium allomyrinae]MCC2033314.1 2Fe-2S iron-sulfur cluster binding domain-containing protein [Microbacterium allomyrinae]